MGDWTLTAICSFGLESVLCGELRALGYQDLTVENSQVHWRGGPLDVARCNLWLRTADRVLLRMGRFPAHDFGQLFEGVRAIAWEELIPADGLMHVIGKSVKSKLHSVPDCQSITKKAVVEAMKRRHARTTFEETGALYRIQVSILKDEATITVDTSGDGLFKRGYRTQAGEAPLKETMAAALVLLSRWTPDRVFADPMCGAGTLAVEAAWIGRRMAPGLRRPFSSQQWGAIPPQAWTQAREEARDLVRPAVPLEILAGDADAAVLQIARRSATAAGLQDGIRFVHAPVQEFRCGKSHGVMLVNPPYGERLGEEQEVRDLARDLGSVFRTLTDWSLFVLTAQEDFERCFGRRSDKNRKLYNGPIRCYLYQFWGPLPRRPDGAPVPADG